MDIFNLKKILFAFYEVIISMKNLQTKTQGKNMITSYHDLFFTVIYLYYYLSLEVEKNEIPDKSF